MLSCMPPIKKAAERRNWITVVNYYLLSYIALAICFQETAAVGFTSGYSQAMGCCDDVLPPTQQRACIGCLAVQTRKLDCPMVKEKIITHHFSLDDDKAKRETSIETADGSQYLHVWISNLPSVRSNQTRVGV